MDGGPSHRRTIADIKGGKKMQQSIMSVFFQLVISVLALNVN